MPEQKAKQVTRREFLKAGTMAAGAMTIPYIIPASVMGKADSIIPGNRATVGFIGIGGMGTWHLAEYLGIPRAHVLAVCDVSRDAREKAKKMVDEKYGNTDCTAYNDYRELMARDDIDTVYIATPDHWHALQTIAAARAGKDIYCQKPLTLTVAEGQAVREAVNRYAVVFQHGTQQRSDSKMVFGCELVRNGRIGQLKHVKLVQPAGAQTDPQPVKPVPDGFDYDMWIGPAPMPAYTPLRTSGAWHSWYFISDYCIGHLSGWGVHHIDSAQQGTGVDDTGPIEVDAKGVFPKDGLYDAAVTWEIQCLFKNGVTWDICDTITGKSFCERFGTDDGGILFEGTEGWVFIWRGMIDAHPKSLLKETIGPDEIHLYKSDNHIANFFDCVKSRRPTAAPVEVGHRSTTICSLSDISMRLGRKIRWNPDTEQIIDDPEATRMLSRAYRAPWKL